MNVECPPLLEDELLVSIGKKYKKSSAQVALRFNVQRGVVVIPKSFSPERIKHNFQVYFLSLHLNPKIDNEKQCFCQENHVYFFFLLQIFDFSLTEEEMKAVEALNKNFRFVELLM